MLNDFAKIGATRDAFLMFYDESPLKGNGLGGGFFNGAQEFAFNKTALEKGLPVAKVTVARENMGLLKTPDGTCFSDNKLFQPGIACWIRVIPATPPNGQFDNSHGGTGFMLATIDFYCLGGNQLAAFDWTGLKNLNSAGCSACSGIRFGGQLFSGVQHYYNPSNARHPAIPRPAEGRADTAGQRVRQGRGSARSPTAPRPVSPPTATMSRRPRRATASCGPARIPRSCRRTRPKPQERTRAPPTGWSAPAASTRPGGSP